MAIVNNYVAIDPLALLLPSSVYVRLVEKFHPHVPKVAEVLEAAKGMTAEERASAISQARNLAAHAKVVEEALSSVAAKGA